MDQGLFDALDLQCDDLQYMLLAKCVKFCISERVARWV